MWEQGLHPTVDDEVLLRDESCQVRHQEYERSSDLIQPTRAIDSETAVAREPRSTAYD